MVPGPVQAAAAVALDDDAHVDGPARARYRRRLEAVVAALAAAGLPTAFPGGAFYLWVPAPDGDGAALDPHGWPTRAGVLATPGATYGPDGRRLTSASPSSSPTTGWPSCAGGSRPWPRPAADRRPGPGPRRSPSIGRDGA